MHPYVESCLRSEVENFFKVPRRYNAVVFTWIGQYSLSRGSLFCFAYKPFLNYIPQCKLNVHVPFLVHGNLGDTNTLDVEKVRNDNPDGIFPLSFMKYACENWGFPASAHED